MEPLGKAIRAFLEGDTGAQLIVCRDDGRQEALPVSVLFRDPEESSSIDNAALENCRGRVLDVGAGSGLHSLVLQRKGLPVTSLDVSPHCVAVMKQRGVQDARCGDILDFQGGPFDTILMMGHGIGIVETIAGLDRFLDHTHTLRSGEGQILLDSVDVRVAEDPSHLAYHEANRNAGRYIGEIRLQLEFRGQRGPSCGWLHVDSETLRDRAQVRGWQCRVLVQGKSGDYLAKLTPLEK